MAEHDQDQFSGILEPLRQYALEHLPASMLAQLRQVNTSAQLPDTDHGDGVQRLLREHGALLQMLRAGMQRLQP